jgi:hypothetical protein
MKLSEVISKIRSGVVSISFYINNEKINSGSGFLCKNKLISANHVFFDPAGNPINGSNIKIINGDSDTIFDGAYDELMHKLVTGSHQDNHDYAIFNIGGIPSGSYQFELMEYSNIEEGADIIAMGFPFGLENLTTSTGIISAKYQKKSVDYIQIDATTNAGNSGGPLIDKESLNVVGIITRKETGLNKDFDQLVNSFAQNIQVLKQAQLNGSIGMMGINPIQMFEISQTQMLVVSNNIKRSANTGISYAFSCDQLAKEI